MAKINHSNVAVDTTLTSGINSSTTSIPVAALTGWPSAPFYAVLTPGDVSTEEVILVTAVVSLTLTATRGADGATAKTHSSGATVRHPVVAHDLEGWALNGQEVSATAATSGQALVHNGTLFAPVDIATQAELDSEAATRASADTTLQTNITSEASTRASADTTNATNLTTHAALTTSAHGGIVASTDPRLTDSRTPTAHASTHASVGSDPVTLAESQVTNLVSDLAAKAPLASPALTGTPTAPTASGGTSTTQIATTAFVTTGSQPLDATLTALAAYNTNGLLTQTAADTFAGRTLTGTSNRLSITNGNGVSGNPTADIDAAYVGQASITTLGTVATGTWSATTIALAKGGTNADLSATGGASQVVKQSSAGAALTVAALTSTDMAASDDGTAGVLIDHFLQNISTTTATGPLLLLGEAFGSGSTNSTLAPVDTSLGVLNVTTGTATNGRSGVRTSFSAFRFGGGIYDCSIRLYIPTLADATDDFFVVAGFLDATSSSIVDGAYLWYDRTNGFRYRTRSNSTETDTASGVTPAAATWYTLRIQVNAAASSVTFTINGANSVTITTNIPSGSGRETGIFAQIVKTAASANARSLYLDFIRLGWSGF